MSTKLCYDWCDKEINSHTNERVNLDMTSTYRKDWMKDVVLCRTCGDLAINALGVTALACKQERKAQVTTKMIINESADHGEKPSIRFDDPVVYDL